MQTANNAPWDPKTNWHRFRLEAEAAKHYHLSYLTTFGPTRRDVLLEQLLPTLLYIKSVAILDDSLARWLDQNGYILIKPYRDDLNGRINYLADMRLLDDAHALHPVRSLRNTLAHEPGTSCDWADLDRDIQVIEASLIALGMADVTGTLEFFFTRSQMEASNDPRVAFTQEHSYGVRENGTPSLTISWIVTTYRIGE